MKPQSKLFLALGIIIVSIILTILILRTNFLHALSSLQYYKSNRGVNNICQLQNDRLKDVLSLPSPKEKEKMLQGEDRETFLLWKELFLKTNQVSEDYFNDHIRIENIDGVDGFYISYYYVVDWAFISLSDKITDSATMIEDIRNSNRDIVGNIITCKEAADTLKVKLRNKFLIPFLVNVFYTDLSYNNHIILFIETDSLFRQKCVYSSINLENGSFDSFGVSNNDCSSWEGTPPGI